MKTTKGTEMQEPRLVEVKDGWAALGDGWAVFGPTPADARRLFGAAEDKHAELRAREGGPQTSRAEWDRLLSLGAVIS